MALDVSQFMAALNASGVSATPPPRPGYPYRPGVGVTPPARPGDPYGPPGGTMFVPPGLGTPAPALNDIATLLRQRLTEPRVDRFAQARAAARGATETVKAARRDVRFAKRVKATATTAAERKQARTVVRQAKATKQEARAGQSVAQTRKRRARRVLRRTVG